MRHRSWLLLGMGCVLVACGLSACAKKDKTAGGEQKQTESAAADNAAPPPTQALTTANAPFAPVITAKGYQVVQARRFPAQVDSRRATVVVYRTADGSRGGVLYVRGFESDPPRPVWHWYFANGAPDSVQALDLNQDGLWDLRVFMAGGTTSDYQQDAVFTFAGAEHPGLFAMNGSSSAPDGLWKAFDADTSTAWQAPGAGAFIEIPNPFGLETGQLSVRLSASGRPAKLEVSGGEAARQECDLQPTTEEQRFLLDPAFKSAATIRVSVVGGGKNVAISELEIQ